MTLQESMDALQEAFTEVVDELGRRLSPVMWDIVSIFREFKHETHVEWFVGLPGWARLLWLAAHGAHLGGAPCKGSVR